MMHGTMSLKKKTRSSMLLVYQFGRSLPFISVRTKLPVLSHGTWVLKFVTRICLGNYYRLSPCFGNSLPSLGAKSTAHFISGSWLQTMEARTTGRGTRNYSMFLSLVQFAYAGQPMKPHHFLLKRDVIGLTLRRLMSYIYIYGAPILDVSRSHTTTQHSR